MDSTTKKNFFFEVRRRLLAPLETLIFILFLKFAFFQLKLEKPFKVFALKTYLFIY